MIAMLTGGRIIVLEMRSALALTLNAAKAARSACHFNPATAT